MRALMIGMLIAGLAGWGGQALAQSPPPPSQPAYSADGLYNLANSYARAGKPGLAVLNYERASLLAPMTRISVQTSSTSVPQHTCLPSHAPALRASPKP